MDSLSWLQVLAYIAFAVLVIGVAVRAIKYFTMPIHLRWELYPVPHEKKEGSYFEEIDWWKKPRKKHYLNHIIFVIQEILFIRALYHHNRKLWNFSFPFHLRLYLVIGWLALLLLSAILNTFGLGANLAEFARRLAVFIGVFGFILGIIGSIGLIIKKATAEELKGYTAPVGYFNVIFILMVFVSGIGAWVTSDPHFLSVRAFVEGLITLKSVEVSTFVSLHITFFPFL